MYGVQKHCSFMMLGFVLLHPPRATGQVLQAPELGPSVPVREKGAPPNLIARSNDVRIDYPDLPAEDRKLPSHLEYSQNFSLGSARLELWRQIPLDVDRLAGSSLILEDRLWYELDAGALAQCGWDDETARRLSLKVHTNFQVVRDWTISSSTQLDELSSPDDCNLTILDINVKAALLKEARHHVDDLLPKLDGIVKSKAVFRPAAEQFWQQLQQPRPSGNYALLSAPQLVATSNILFDETSKKIVVPLLILHAPIKVPAASSGSLQSLPLPPLMLPGDTQAISIPGELPFDLSQLGDAAMDVNSGLPAHALIYARRKTEFDGLQLFAVDEKVGSRIDFHVIADRGRITPVVDVGSGFRRLFEAVRYRIDKHHIPFKGTVYVIGQPSLDNGGTVLVLEPLLFSPESLASLRAFHRSHWIESSPFLPTLAGAIRFSIASQLTRTCDGLSNSATANIDAAFRLLTQCTSVSATAVRTVSTGLAVSVVSSETTSVVPIP